MTLTACQHVRQVNDKRTATVESDPQLFHLDQLQDLLCDTLSTPNNHHNYENDEL